MSKKRSLIGSVGIKNSWKYEKDLIILNRKLFFNTITRLDSIILKESNSFIDHVSIILKKVKILIFSE